VLRVGQVVSWIIGVAVVLAAAPVGAQSNLDAGKSPAQIFSDTCGACHRSPRELKPTSPGFMREHYTTGGREAATMAAYLASVGSDPRAVQQRRPPALGAKPPAPAEASTAVRPPQTIPAGCRGLASLSSAAMTRPELMPRARPWPRRIFASATAAVSSSPKKSATSGAYPPRRADAARARPEAAAISTALPI